VHPDRESPSRTGRHRILHLSDPHLTRTGTDEDGVDAVAALERILHDARFVPDVDLVVVSGDVADDGTGRLVRVKLMRAASWVTRPVLRRCGAAPLWGTRSGRRSRSS
jgi:3',5'-cyclic AMP phosphodiesterase CpdA